MGGAQGGGDYVGVIEAAYSAQSDEQSWLDQLAGAAACLDAGAGVVIYTYDASDPASFRAGAVAGAQLRVPLEEIARLVRFADAPQAILDPAAVVALYSPAPPVVLLSRIMAPHYVGSPVQRDLAALGIADVIGARAADASRRGCLIGVSLPERRPIPRRARATIEQIAAHVAAGYRLRITATGAPLDSADVIYDTRGRLQHVREPVGGAERRAIDYALEQRAAARGPLRSMDPEAALSVWRGLVDGRWSVVDHADRDGKRFVLVRRNDPSVRDLAALTRRERQVATYAALGHSLKLIAYELGLSVSTVSEHLKGALRKLGLRDRLELQRLFGAQRDREGGAT